MKTDAAELLRENAPADEEVAPETPTPLYQLSDKEAKKREKLKKREKREQARLREKNAKRPQRVAEKAAERVAASHAARADAAKAAEKAAEKQRLSLLREQQKQTEKAARAAAENDGDVTLYDRFCAYSFIELEQLLRRAETREERAFYRSLLNLKLQIEQEKVIGEVLL